MKRDHAWMCATAMLFAGAIAATAAAQKPPEPLPTPGPEAPPPQGSATGTALPPAPPPPATTAPPAYPPGYPPQGYPPGYAPPGYYPGYAQPGYYPPGYGYPGYGQPAYGAPPPYAQGYPAAPPYIPPPPEERGVHLHDGFYMRLAIGIGSIHTTVKPDGGGDEATWSGSGMALDFGFGGAVADGFIIGGRFAVSGASDPDFKVSGTTLGTSGSLSMGALQLFTDIYPWANGGFHILAGFGPGFFSYDPTPAGDTYQSESDTSSADGYAGTIGLGWEGWVGSQWGIGGMLNLNVGRFHDTVTISQYSSISNSTTVYDSKSTLTAVSPTLMFTATFN